MLNCRQVARLVSQSMDASLPWHRRLAVRIHLLYCVWCRRYAAQVRLLRKAAGRLSAEELECSAERLSEEDKQKMRQSLQDALRSSPQDAGDASSGKQS